MCQPSLQHGSHPQMRILRISASGPLSKLHFTLQTFPSCYCFRQYEERIAEIQSTTSGRRTKVALTPLQRGWTSASPQGKKFAPPLEPNSASKYILFLELLDTVAHIANLSISSQLRWFRMRSLGNEASVAHDWQFRPPALRFDSHANRKQKGAKTRLMWNTV